MEPWESAYEDYMAGMKYKDIASKHGVKLDTVKNWKKRKWGKFDTDTKDTKPKVSSDTDTKTKPRGNPQNLNKGPARNQFARVHGLYAKWLPEDIQEITGIVPEDPLEIAWQNIQLQQAKIIKSFQLQNVKDKSELITRTISSGESGDVYQYHEAFDRDNNFLQGLSRAMATLTNMLAVYDKMLHENWDMATELQKARLEKARAEASLIKAEMDSKDGNVEPIALIDDIPAIEGGEVMNAGGKVYHE